MLTDSDESLIEKYLDNKLQPNSPTLSNEEEIIFKERMQDPEFQNHLKLSDEVNNVILRDDELQFIRTLKKASNDYHEEKG